MSGLRSLDTNTGVSRSKIFWGGGVPQRYISF
nr:MAG TPA: hypothetical protein [Caudoviricetes sp.]